MDANGLRENSRVEVTITQVLLTLPIPLLFVTHWCLKALKCQSVSDIPCANSNMMASGNV